MRHAGRHAHRLITWLGGIAAVLILVAVGGIWRLMQGPIELDGLIPFVQAALQRSGNGFGVAVSGVEIGIDATTHQIDLRVRDVRLASPDGQPLANFPEMATSFSLGALLRGQLAPTRVAIERPVVLLTRDPDGAVSLRIGDAGSAARDIGLDSPGELLVQRPGSPWGQLARIDVRDARIIVDDRQSGHVWQASRIAASLNRSRDGSEGDLSFAVVLAGSTPELHASYRYAAATETLDIDLAVDRLDPTALAPLLPVLAPLAQARFPVSGSLSARIDLAADLVEGARIDLALGAGQLQTALLTGGELAFNSGELHADYSPDTGELKLEKLALKLAGGVRLAVDGTLGGAVIGLTGGALRGPQALAGTIGVTLSQVPASRIEGLWPRALSPGGRRWVAANIPDGVLDELALHAALKLDLAAGGFDLSDTGATLHYHDLTINYFKGLPPVRQVSGSATLSGHQLDFTAAGGAVKGLKVTGGTVSISELGTPVEWLAADVSVAGPLQDALETLDAKPLHYARDAGVDPAHAGGRVEAQLHFKFPLLDQLRLDMVDYAAKATFAGISYAKIALGRDFSDGDLSLDLARTGVHVQGGGRFDGNKATIDANLYFHPKNGPRARYRIGLALDDAARQRLDWDFPAWVGGPLAVDLTYTVRDATRARIDAALDLADARLSLAELGWQKPPGTPGTAKLTLDLDNDAVSRVRDLEITAPGLDGSFAVGLSADRKRVERVEIRRLLAGDSDIAGTVSRRAEGGWHADIHGARLDLSHAIKQISAEDTPDRAPPLAIDARFDRLLLGPRREARNVAASLLRSGGGWQTVRIDATYPNGRRLALRLGGAAGAGRLHVETDDLGAALALFGVADTVSGGSLTIDGSVTATDGHRVLRAHLAGADYGLARSPTLVRLLSLASLEGLVSMVSGANIPFTALRGDVAYTEGRIAIERLFAYGGALGVTAAGWYSPAQEKLDIAGTVAPAYALNSILGNVPVIGALLMGGEGQSLFAASFRLGGSSDTPTVSVNPLSGLTPGLLRHLFDPFTAAPTSEPAQAAQ